MIDLRPAHLDGPIGLYARLRAKDLGSSSLMYAHDYLHAFAEAIRRARVDPRTGSDILRHADPALMLRTYQHPDRAQMSRAARKIGPALRPAGGGA